MDHLPKEKFYTVSEAAGYLGISVNTLKRWEEKGKIVVGRTPTGIRVYRKEELDLLKESFNPALRSLRQFENSSDASTPAGSSKSSVTLGARSRGNSSEEFSHAKSPRALFNQTLILTLFGLVILFLTTTIILFQYSPLPNRAVLGVKDFITPVLAEEGPVANLVSPIIRLASQLGVFFQQRVGLFLLALIESTGMDLTDTVYSTLPSGIRIEGDNIYLGSSSEGTTTVNNNFEVLGYSAIQSLQVQGSLDVWGPTTLSSLSTNTLTTTSSTSIGGNLTVSGSTSLTTLTVSGTINGNTLTSTKLTFSGSNPTISPSTTNSAISLNANGTGAINIGNSGTGDVYLAGGSGNSGCTITNSNGSLNCSSDITTAQNINGGGGTFNTLRVNSSSTTTISAILKAVSSQTADILQIRNSLDTVLAKIDADGDLTARTLESTVSTGTAPLVVASTTQVANLNASTLGGNTAATISPVVDVQTFTANGTWTKPANTKWVQVIVIGGGGGGGGGQGGAAGTARSGAAGGGGGARVERTYHADALGATESITIGAAGTGGPGGSSGVGTNGGVGGTSSFGSHVSAYGGGWW